MRLNRLGEEDSHGQQGSSSGSSSNSETMVYSWSCLRCLTYLKTCQEPLWERIQSNRRRASGMSVKLLQKRVFAPLPIHTVTLTKSYRHLISFQHLI